YQIISASNNLIEINVTDNLDNTIYNYSLSAYVKVPDNWQFVKTEQNGVLDTLQTIVSDTGRVVLAKIIPDNGLLKLTPVAPSSINDGVAEVTDFKLSQNYPNPFNPGTKISWQTPVAGWQTIKVYDVLGNEVATLVNEYKPAGMYNVQFTIHNEQLSSGMYFYQLKVGDYTETKKMMYVK
ncbi:MAG TPA: T9SS type A sorting domain-containing protein, partial [Ignavibacteriaceae bacterium]